MNMKNRKNIVIVVAMIAVLAIAGISAYFTATDSATNTFTVGKVTIEQQEPNWDPDNPPTDITPNQEIEKDPQIKNTGDNAAYVYEVVRVPKESIITSNTESGAKAASAAMTQLFQLNKTKDSAGAKEWTGTDTYHDDAWTLVATNPTGVPAAILADYNVYVFGYGSASAMTALAPNATTSKPVFESVTFCNAVSEQGLEDATLNIKVNGFAIQTDNITSNDVTTPAGVWAILNVQDGALASLD